jgi:hypothetical protein
VRLEFCLISIKNRNLALLKTADHDVFLSNVMLLFHGKFGGFQLPGGGVIHANVPENRIPLTLCAVI